MKKVPVLLVMFLFALTMCLLNILGVYPKEIEVLPGKSELILTMEVE